MFLTTFPFSFLYRAAADVLYEILTMMVKKGPLTVSESDEL